MRTMYYGYNYRGIIFAAIIVFSVLMVISLIVIGVLSASTRSRNEKGMPWIGYINLPSHVLLLIFTLGIYHLCWIYKITDRLNIETSEPKRSPAAQILLCVFIPFYSLYWYYKTSQRIDKISANIGIKSELSSVIILVCLFVPCVAPIIIQEKLNTISPEILTCQNQMNLSKELKFNYDEEIKSLKKYKELLDEEIITSDEFEAKKKEIMRF